MRNLFMIAALIGSAFISIPAAYAVDLDLSPYKGKVVYVDMWASWCPPCLASFPWMEEMHQDLEDQGLVILAVNTNDEPADAARFLEHSQPSFTIISDPRGDIAVKLGAIGMPYAVLFDRNGERVSSHVGFIPANAPALRQKIEAELAKDVSEGLSSTNTSVEQAQNDKQL